MERPAGSGEGIGTRGVAAVKWSVAGTAAGYVLQLCTQVTLARLLGPDNYGLFAMGLLVMLFANFIADFGFGWNLVQSESISRDDVRFVFTWQLICGLVVGAGLFAAAPLVAGFFGEPRVQPIVRWLSLACVMNALASPAANLLRRDIDFRSLSLIQLAGYATGYVAVGLPLAWFGFGVWALVAAWLTQSFCILLLCVLRRPYPAKPLLWHARGRVLSGLGCWVFATNLCNWFLNNMDRVLLGRLVNAQAVGLYVVGYNLACTFNSLLLGALQPAFHTTGARIQSEPERLRRAYLAVIGTVWILVAPVFLVLAVIAGDLVPVLYGESWSPAAMVLMLLALAMPAYITWGMSTPILWNTGAKHLESLLQVPVLVLAVTALYLLAGEGITAVAAVAAATLVARALVITATACRRLDVGVRDLAPFAVRSLLVGLLAVAGAWTGLEMGRDAAGGHWGAVLGGIVVGLAVPAVVSLAVPRLIGATVIEMLGRFVPSLPATLAGYARSAR